MNFESGIAIIWFLPVTVQIVLPLIMLLFHGVGKLLTSVFELNPSDEVREIIQGKPRLPTTAAIS